MSCLYGCCPDKDLKEFWEELSEWSQVTFGTDNERGPIGPLKHLSKEVKEVLIHAEQLESMDERQELEYLEEFSDCLFLVFDACRRAGFSYVDLCNATFAKLEKNKIRKWPKPTNDEPVEHVRNQEELDRLLALDLTNHNNAAEYRAMGG